MNQEIIAWCLIFSPMFLFGLFCYFNEWLEAIKALKLYSDNDGIIVMSAVTIIGIMFLIGWYLLLFK